jgi:dienelactone hydrolase
MISENIEYAADERNFAGFLVCNEVRGGRRAGILVCHEGGGLDDHTKDRARMLAELGYVAFAPDLFGEAFTSRQHAISIINGLVEDPPRLRGRANAALQRLKSHPSVDPTRTAAIGFCFGGLAALELARSGADFGCAVSFHGGLQTRSPAKPGDIKASILVCHGALDPFISREARMAFEEEMTTAGADWQMNIYANAKHGFTNRKLDPEKSPGSAYHQPTDERSWTAMRALFDEAIGVP